MTLDITGLRSGKLVAIESVPNRNQRTWKCLCDCGNTIELITTLIKNGNRTHCGCLKYNGVKPGDVYGLWTVHSRSNKFWLCVCTCGNLGKVTTSDLLRNDGKQSGGCRDCFNKRNTKYSLNEGAARNAFHHYKKNAKSRGYSFQLSFEEFVALTQQNCFYCESEPNNTQVKTSKEGKDFVYNGIDRIRNIDGYTASNCVPCCMQCNRGKSDSTVEDFYHWINKVNDRRNDVQAVLVEKFGFDSNGFIL